MMPMKYTNPFRKKRGSEKVSITTETSEFFISRGVPLTSIRRIFSRGHYWSDQVRTPLKFNKDDATLFYRAASKAAGVLSRRHHIVHDHYDDLIQEAVLRMLELYTKSKGEGQLVNFAKFSMLELLRVQYKISAHEVLLTDLEFQDISDSD